MVIDLSPEVEARVMDTARYEGSSAEDVVKNAVLWFTKLDELDRASIQRGIDQANRGDFISEEEMTLRYARMMQPR